MEENATRDEMRRQEREEERLRALEGKVGARKHGATDEKHVRDLEKQMAEREVQQADALRNMRGSGAVARDGRITPDVPDHLNNPDATVEDRIKDLERRANTAEVAEQDLMRAGRGVRDAASDGADSADDPGEAADASDALHGATSATMPLDPANARLDPQPAVDPVKAPKAAAHPETAFGAPTPQAGAKDAKAAQAAQAKAPPAAPNEHGDYAAKK